MVNVWNPRDSNWSTVVFNRKFMFSGEKVRDVPGILNSMEGGIERLIGSVSCKSKMEKPMTVTMAGGYILAQKEVKFIWADKAEDSDEVRDDGMLTIRSDRLVEDVVEG